MKAVVFLAEGFEEIEAISVIDILRRAEVDVKTVSINDDNLVKGAHGIEVNADNVIDDIDSYSDYNAIVIPGGLPGATNLRDSEKVLEAVKSAYDKNNLVSAICAGPIVLQKAGALGGKKVTCYPGFEDELVDAVTSGNGVERDKNVITGKGPAYAMDFAIEIVDYLLGSGKAQEVKDGLLKK